MRGGGTFRYVYNITAGIPAVIEESTERSTVYNIREPGGESIARMHPTEGMRYYYFDELGSTRLLTDGSGTVTDRYAYDAYGSLLAHDRYTGSVNQPYQYVGRLGYYTHYQEFDFGLLQLGVRFYDPEAWRFTQKDPMVVTMNCYAYVGGKPLQRVDPSGLFGCWPGMGCEMEMERRGREAFARARCCLCRWRKWWTDRHPWNKRHAPKYGLHMDKVAHCFVACKCVKEGNPAEIVQVYADLKELYDAVLHCLRLKGDDTGDEAANAAGMSIAATKGSNCLPDCLKWVQSVYGDVPKKHLGPWDPEWEVQSW